MGLEDFERELAAKQEKDRGSRHKRHRSRSRERRKSDKDRHRSRSVDGRHRHGHSKHQSSRHHRDRDEAEEDERHKHKRSRHHGHHDSTNEPKRTEDSPEAGTKDGHAALRDSWMQAPSSLDIDYVQRKDREEKGHFVAASTSKQLGQSDRESKAFRNEHASPPVSSVAHVRPEVSYTFGDSGAQWRMMKLKGVYSRAEAEQRPVEEVALDQYGDLRSFDDAREEELELDRRDTYGKGYVSKEKPSGELYGARGLQAGPDEEPAAVTSDLANLRSRHDAVDEGPSEDIVEFTQTQLNKLKAQLMKAKLKKSSDVAQLEAQYDAAVTGGVRSKPSNVVVLSAMDNRMLAGGRQGEVKDLTTKRGTERGLVVENQDMSIDDMVRQERRTRGQAGGEGMILADKIARDAKFDNDLEYLDENAEKLATRAPKSTTNLRNAAIADYQRTNRILDNCPLCHHEDKSPPQPPVAPIISLATRVFLTLPTEPELGEGGAVVVPIQHRVNLLECDDDEWDEIRNFMKCLTRLYHDQGRDVIFYENAANPGRKLHAALNAVPIPYDLGETAPAFFREAILSSDAEWSQHKPIIDTLKAARTLHGKAAFRKSLAKEMPYFHVWFELDGGMGHIVEDERRWPRGDLFAREVLGGMLDVDMETIKRQGRWNRGDRRADKWAKRWRRFDWTKALAES